MTRREAFRSILAHKTPDRVLLDLAGCPLSGLSGEAAHSLYEYMGYTGSDSENLERLLVELDIDTRGVGGIFVPEKSQYRRLTANSYIDAWGIERRYTGLYWDFVNTPLADADIDDLERYPWPDPDTIPQKAIDDAVAKAKFLHEETDYVVCASHPVYGVFELGCWMCGFEEFLVRMLTDEPFVHRFFEIVLEYQKKVIERYYPPLAPYIDYTSSGDDFATQNDLFISPELFREQIAPYFKERIAYTKKFTDAAFLHHSCGNVSRLIPQLIECGVEILNPIQPTGDPMNPARLKQNFGRDIIFHGGLDTQAVLPMGNEQTIRTAVNDLLDVMQPEGGYIFAAAHNLQADVPPENIVAMFRAARAWKRK